MGSILIERSVHEEGHAEALRHKWNVSAERGCDVGDVAVDEWYDRYWTIYSRHRRLEHLRGTHKWIEFGEDDFGLIEQLLDSNDLLLELILDRAESGWELLHFINWALDWNLPMDRVINILARLDLNRGRLEPRYPTRYACHASKDRQA
jgi:hypothetical protein